MTLFLFANLHDSSQQESGLLVTFQQSLFDYPFHYLVAHGMGNPDAQAIQLTEGGARSVVERFLEASFSYAGTANQRISAPHFAVVADEVNPQAILWEYISASPFSTNLRAFNATSFEAYCFADKLFQVTPNIQSLLVPLPIVERDDLGMEIKFGDDGNNVILYRS